MAPSRLSGLTSRLLPFNPSTTPAQAATYLLGISLFSISFLVFLNSAVSFVITDLLGVKEGVGDIVGTLGFADELVALIACPLWGLLSDRLGVRWVAVLGYTVIAVSLWVFVTCRNVYPALILARILFAVGATAAATMVTAILPVLTDEEGEGDEEGKHDDILSGPGLGERSGSYSGPEYGRFESPHDGGRRSSSHNPRGSIAVSLESDATITPERFTQSSSGCPGLLPDSARHDSNSASNSAATALRKGKKTSALAGFVGLFTGCGALVALALFLPLPARFGEKEGVTPAQAITYSFRVVGTVALGVAVFVFFGLRGLKGEENKGWRMLLGLKENRGSSSASSPTIVAQDDEIHDQDEDSSRKKTGAAKPLPYRHLMLSSLRLGTTDPHIALGYLGGFVARASTVAISLFVPLYVNAYFMNHGFCRGSPNDPSPDLKRECRAAYVLAASLSGAAQFIALLCAPLFGYINARRYRGVNWGVLGASLLGVVGYLIFPRLASPEFRDVDGRGGSPVVFAVAALLGVSQIGAIVCSLGSLGHGVLGEDVVIGGGSTEEDGQQEEDAETEALLGREGNVLRRGRRTGAQKVSRVQLKGSIAGVYSWCGGAAILLLTKLGGYLFDALSTGAPFYMMAIFNAVLLVVSLGIDIWSLARSNNSRRS